MAHYKSVQRISDAMIYVKKLCRELSPRFNEVQLSLTQIGDCEELVEVSRLAGKPAPTHIDMAKYRSKVARANLLVEEANMLMAEVHLDLNDEAVRFGCDDHLYRTSKEGFGPGGR